MARSLGVGQKLARRRFFVILVRKDELFRLRVVSGAGIDILFPFHIGPLKRSTV
jgi:hypothetical protein